MDQQKIILVTGATGAQGGSVARFLLEDGTFRVRCLTRTPESDSSLSLLHAGAEIVEGDLENTDSLSAAMHDAYGVFGVTNFWEHFENEYRQGKNLVDAVVKNHVDYFIYSSLPSAEKTSSGRFKVPHLDNKAALQSYAKAVKEDSAFVHVAGYYENFLSFCLPQKEADEGYYLSLPQGDTRYASVSVEDLGGVVRTMFQHPRMYKGRTVGVVGHDTHCNGYAAILSKVLGVDIRYRAVSREDYAAQGFPGAEELASMYAYNTLYIPNRQLDLIESYGLYPAMQGFESWVTKNKTCFLNALQQQEVVTG